MVKKIFFGIIDFLLFSNLFIALAAVAQLALTYRLLGLPAPTYLLAFICCSTLLVYNLSMLLVKPVAPQNSVFKRVRWIFKHLRLQISVTLVAAISVVALALFYLSIPAILLMSFVGLIALAYNYPLFKIKQQQIRIRNLPGLKLFLIALVWTLSCVLLPMVEVGYKYGISIPTNEILLLLTQRFLFICALTIPFDIRDLFEDNLYHLKTIPVILGERKTIIFCQLLLAGALILMFLFTKNLNLANIGLSFTFILTGWLIFKAKLKKNEYYYFFFLDGMLILQFLVLWVCEMV